jgi:hypothetical protein
MYKVSPKLIRDEILDCIKREGAHRSHLGDGSRSAEDYLRDAFAVAGGDFEKPDYPEMLDVLRILAARELASGKEASLVSRNFLKIGKKLKIQCGLRC